MYRAKTRTIESFEIPWLEVAQDPSFWDKIAQEDVTPQKLFNVSEELIKDYYVAATELLNEKHWNEARDAFLFLTFLNPTYQNFWLGLGIAEQASGDIQAAIVAYLLAEVIDASNPSIHTNTYQCYVALENKKSADWAYHKAVQAFGDKPEYADKKQAFIQYCADLDASRRSK